MPVQFLEQLFAVLRRAGVISSQRGVKGGYRFAREPVEVTVLEVVELLDGPLGRDAEGVFADAAEAARKVLAQHDDRRRARARAARRGREHVPHLGEGAVAIGRGRCFRAFDRRETARNRAFPPNACADRRASSVAALVPDTYLPNWS